jgi:hypothetical protein
VASSSAGVIDSRSGPLLGSYPSHCPVAPADRSRGTDHFRGREVFRVARATELPTAVHEQDLGKRSVSSVRRNQGVSLKSASLRTGARTPTMLCGSGTAKIPPSRSKVSAHRSRLRSAARVELLFPHRPAASTGWQSTAERPGTRPSRRKRQQRASKTAPMVWSARPYWVWTRPQGGKQLGSSRRHPVWTKQSTPFSTSPRLVQYRVVSTGRGISGWSCPTGRR